MAYEQIIYEVADNIATITLNRPEKLNAFTGIMMNEMLDAFDKADADDNVRAVIVTGAGRAFCAGADLSAGPRTFDCDARGSSGPEGRDQGRRHSGLEQRRRSRRRRTADAAHLRMSETGDRGGERTGGGRRRYDAARDGRAARVGKCALRFRVRAARDRAGSVLELVPAEDRRASRRRSSGPSPGAFSRRRRRSKAG